LTSSGLTHSMGDNMRSPMEVVRQFT
jgi:hypothetical protein